MPLIVPITGDGPPLAVLSGGSSISANATATAHLAAHLRGDSSIIATLSASTVSGAAHLVGSSAIRATGRLGSEANIFGAAHLVGGSDIQTANLTALAGAKAVLVGSSDLVANGTLITADKDVLNVVLTVTGAGTATTPHTGFGDVISARISADGVNYPIRNAVYSEPRGAAGVSLDVTLQKTADRAAIAAAESFKFEIFTRGAWRTIFDFGRRSAGTFSVSFVDGRANDQLTLSTIGQVSDRINQSPLSDLTVYDPLRETLHVDDFPKIADIFGHLYPRELHPIGNLTLYQLLTFILVGECGFAGFNSDLPDYPIRRADFEMVGSYLSGLATHIGAFDPLIFVKDNVVWILDSTQKVPAGFAAPVRLTADKYKTAVLSETVLDLDGYVVTFSSDELFYDYYVDSEDNPDPDIYGVFGASNYVEIKKVTTTRNFYKLTNPAVPVRSDVVKQVETTKAIVAGTFLEVAETTETITLDSFGKITSILKNTIGLVPDVETSGFPFVTRTTRTERTNFDYATDITNFRRQILVRTTKTIQGLISTDTANPHLDKPFKQAFTDGLRAGNLASGQTITFGNIQTVVETTEQDLRGQMKVRTRTTDFLTDPPAIINATTDARNGDSSTNALSSTPHQIIVLRPGRTRTNKKFTTLAVGEMPPKYGIPLASRKLANEISSSGSVVLKGIDLDYGRGFKFELIDRDDVSLGNFLVEGRSISLQNLGVAGAQQTTQNLEITKI